jgi:protease secretion system outer membrane protein
MKKTPKATLLCLALALAGSSSWSMDLLQAYEAAQQQDATLQAARASAVAGRERLPQARAQLLPVATASLSATRNNLTSVTPNFLGAEQTTENNYPSSSQVLQLRQPIYRKQLAAQYRQAQAQVNEADATLAQEEQNLAVRLSSAYFEAMLTADQLQLVLSQRAAYTGQLDAATKSFAAGSGIRTDIDEAQARLDMNTALEIEARQNITYTRQQLQSIVNEPVNKLATLDVTKLALLSPEPNQLDDWTARAEINNPQLQAVKAQVEAARQEIEKAKSGHHPTLDAVAQWSRNDSESVTNLQSRYTNASVSLQLNVPLFAGGYVNSQVRQALAGLDRANAILEATRRDLGVRVFREFRGMTEGVPKIKALEQAARSADQLVISSRKSYQGGSRTVLDVLNAEQQRLVVQRDLAQARYIYLLSKVRLLALVGEADIAAVTALNTILQN